MILQNSEISISPKYVSKILRVQVTLFEKYEATELVPPMLMCIH